MEVGDMVITKWGAVGTIKSIQQKPYQDFPENNLTAEVEVEGGVEHRLCLDGLTPVK